MQRQRPQARKKQRASVFDNNFAHCLSAFKAGVGLPHVVKRRMATIHDKREQKKMMDDPSRLGVLCDHEGYARSIGVADEVVTGVRAALRTDV